MAGVGVHGKCCEAFFNKKLESVNKINVFTGDDDGDGIPDHLDDDDDNDGVPDVEDNDDDGDGIPDEDEGSSDEKILTV